MPSCTKIKDMYFELEGVCEEKCSVFQWRGLIIYYYNNHFHADKTIANYAGIQINDKAISHFNVYIDEKVQLEVIIEMKGRQIIYIHGQVHVYLLFLGTNFG